MKFHELLVIWPSIDEESAKRLNDLKRPVFLTTRRLLVTRCVIYLIGKLKAIRAKLSQRVPVPKDLNDITIGQVLLLSSSDDLFLPFRELLKMGNEQIAMLDVTEAVGFINFVQSELKRINELIASARTEPTPEERQSGIELVGRGLGSFGTLDYIAKRCNISHDAAAEMPWQRVYAMMVLDRDNELFRRRLTETYNKKRK